jgi:predicted O-methyltransferase YrrM
MPPIVDQPETYFRKFIRCDDTLLRELESEAQTEKIPIIGPVVGELLFVLARALRARSILELGTATGYSAIHLARACALNAGQLISLEHDPGLAGRARQNLQRAGLAPHATVVCADALGHLHRMDGLFDLVFLDIEKGDYLRALPDCQRLLRPGGLLVADNVAFPDADPFNRAIFSDSRWRPVALLAFFPGHSPEHDGLCLALRCEEAISR